MYLFQTSNRDELNSIKRKRAMNERRILKKFTRDTRMIVKRQNGSHFRRKLIRILGYMCFEGIDRDTSSVRVLAIDVGWASLGHACIHLLILTSLTYRRLSVSTWSIIRFSSVRHWQSLCVLLIYMHRQTFTACSVSIDSPLFFYSSIDYEENSVRYLCVRQSIVRALAFFQVFIWQPMRGKEWEMTDIDPDQFFYCQSRYTIGRRTKRKQRNF